MKKSSKIIFLLLIFALLPINAFPFSLGFEKLFIDDEKYMGEFIVDLDEIYIYEDNIESIFRRKDITWDTATLAVIIGEKTIPAKIITHNGKVYYPFLSICREFSYPVNWDYTKKIISVKLTPTLQTISEDENNSRPTRRKRGVFIYVFEEDFIKNVMESVVAVRIKADVRNSYARDVKKVEAQCIFSYPDGTVHYTDSIILENIPGGESRRVVFYTTNPSESQTLTYKLQVKEIREKR